MAVTMGPTPALLWPTHNKWEQIPTQYQLQVSYALVPYGIKTVSIFKVYRYSNRQGTTLGAKPDGVYVYITYDTEPSIIIPTDFVQIARCKTLSFNGSAEYT